MPVFLGGEGAAQGLRGLFLIYSLIVAFIFNFVFCLHLVADTLPGCRMFFTMFSRF